MNKKKVLGRGRPTKYRKNFHPESFMALSRQGKSITQIAAEWNVMRETITEWAKKFPDFSVAFKRGRDYCEAWYTNIGQAAMIGKAKTSDGEKINVNLGFYIWLTKNVCRWSDRIDSRVVS